MPGSAPHIEGPSLNHYRLNEHSQVSLAFQEDDNAYSGFVKGSHVIVEHINPD
jgi:hypothetical protein